MASLLVLVVAVLPVAVIAPVASVAVFCCDVTVVLGKGESCAVNWRETSWLW